MQDTPKHDSTASETNSAAGPPPGEPPSDAPGRPAASESAVPSGHQDDDPVAGIWDDWAQERIGELLDRYQVRVSRLGLRPEPLRRALEEAAGQAHRLVTSHLRDGLRMALARPGSVWLRCARWITGFLMTLLPGLATLWVAGQVVIVYWWATLGRAEFLGVPFAVHSVLLVLLAWVIPWWIDRRLRPNLEQAARRGLTLGLDTGLEALRSHLSEALEEAFDQVALLRTEGQQLIDELSRAARECQPVRQGLMARITAKTPPDGVEDGQDAPAR